MNNLETENAKDLHQSRKAMYDASTQYVRSFIDAETGRIHSKYLEFIACPVCKTDDCRILFYKNGGRYVACKKCKMIYLNPTFKNDDLQRYYENNHAGQSASHLEHSEFYKRIYSHGMDSLAKFLNGKKDLSILDIGCSGGMFLDMAKDRGFKTFGCELNTKEIEIAKKKGHDITFGTLENLGKERRYDVITMWDVFEHIKFGVDYLGMLLDYLGDNGLLFLQIPNGWSLAARILHEKCNVFDGIEHVSLYCPSTIKLCANNAKFEIVKMESVIEEIKPIANYLNFDDPYFGNFESSELDKIIDVNNILNSLNGYKLQVVLRKI